MRLLILAFVLSACTMPQKAASVAPEPQPVVKPPVVKPAPAPRNFVCERFAALNPSAICTPELTDAPPRHTHSARVTLDTQLIACITDDTTPSIVCSEPVVVRMQPQPQTPAEKPATENKRKPSKGRWADNVTRVPGGRKR